MRAASRCSPAIGLSGAIAQLAVTRAFGGGGTLLTANLGYTGILFSTAWGYLVFGEPLRPTNALGMAIIVASSVIATVMTARALKRVASRPTTSCRPSPPEASAMHPLVRAEALASQLDDPRWIVFDCRHDLMAPDAGAALYAASHVPGARFASLDRDLAGAKDGTNGRHPLPPKDAFVAFLADAGVNDDSVVVAYDASNGLYASRLWWLVRWIGHADVAVLDGGLPAWQAAGLPTTDAAPRPSRGTIVAREPLVSFVDTADVDANVASRERLVVDARAPERYRGDVEPLDPVAGHIPGAVNHPMARSVGPDGRFRDAASLRADFEATLAGRRPDDVVQSCGSGVTACHNLLAMEVAGLSGARLYPGSWSAWVADPSRPVARGDAA